MDKAKAAPSSNYVSHNLGSVYATIADAHAALAADATVSLPRRNQHREEACSWYRKSAEIRLDLERRGELAQTSIEELHRVLRQTAKCPKAPTAAVALPSKLQR